MTQVDQLTTNEGVISALNRAGIIYARRHQLDVPTLAKTIMAIVAVEGEGHTLPSWALGDASPDPAEAGPIARKALEAMLASPPAEGLEGAAAEAIRDELAGRPHLVDPLSIGIGCGTLLALALMSKWSWSKSGGHQFATGFPDLDKVLGKVGAIIGKLGSSSTVS